MWPTHPLLIVKYLEERQITAILDRQIEALFKGKAILTQYLETNEEALMAFAPVEDLQDPQKFSLAVEWFRRSFLQTDKGEEPQAIEEWAPSSRRPLMTAKQRTDFHITHPLFEIIDKDSTASTQIRNRCWEKRLESILCQYPEGVPVIIAGLAHMGGGSGLLKIAERLGYKMFGKFPQIDQLWTDNTWKPVDMSEELFHTLPSTVNQAESNLT